MDDIRARITLSDLVGRRVKLTRAGREYKACCPFHKEKSPSFYVNDDKQFFHCFGCGAHGDVIGFTMRYDNLSFPDAVERLAAEAGLQMPAFSAEDAERAATQKSQYTLMDTAATWFQTQLTLPQNRDAYSYLTERGLTIDTITNFRLGFSPNHDHAMIQYLQDHGFTEDDMITGGLIKRRDDTGTPYAFFRDRVIFPVMDRSGRVIAFGGRTMPDHLRPPRGTNFKPPKYLNSPETPLFQKGKTVYAVSHARAAAATQEPIVVVEGYMDVIACHQAGVRGAVAPLGTALTEDQILLLWKLMPGPDRTIILCFDGDEAGRRAAARAADRILPLLKPDHSARISFLPDGEDPDTLILKYGTDKFREILAAGMPLAEYIWQIHSGARQLTRPEDRAGLESELDHICAQILDSKIKYHYQNFFRGKMRDRFRPAPTSNSSGSVYGNNAPSYRTGNKNSGQFAPPLPSVRPVSRAGTAQIQGADVMLATLINHPNIFDQIDEKIGFFEFTDSVRDTLRQDIITLLSTDPPKHLSTEGTTGHTPWTRLNLIESLLKKDPQHNDLIQYLMSDTVMVHAAFARPTANDDDARVGFDEVYDHLQKGYKRK